jgi:hypothetical protein
MLDPEMKQKKTPRRLYVARGSKQGQQHPGSAIQKPGLVNPGSARLPVAIYQQGVRFIGR